MSEQEDRELQNYLRKMSDCCFYGDRIKFQTEPGLEMLFDFDTLIERDGVDFSKCFKHNHLAPDYVGERP